MGDYNKTMKEEQMKMKDFVGIEQMTMREFVGDEDEDEL